MPFFIRIRKSTNVGAEKTAASTLFSDLKVGEGCTLPGEKQKVLGHSLHVVGLKYVGRSGEPEHLLLVCQERPHCALDYYRRRWGIETLFAALKSRGFDLEATHLTGEKRLEKLLGLLALAFAWSFLVGEWRHQRNPLKTKNHGRREKSLFRYGLDYLRKIMLNLAEQQEEFLICLQALIAPASFCRAHSCGAHKVLGSRASRLLRGGERLGLPCLPRTRVEAGGQSHLWRES